MVEKTYRLIRKIYYLCFLGLCVVLPFKAALSQGLTLISDAETESYLAKVIQPLFKAAGINFNSNNISLLMIILSTLLSAMATICLLIPELY